MKTVTLGNETWARIISCLEFSGDWNYTIKKAIEDQIGTIDSLLGIKPQELYYQDIISDKWWLKINENLPPKIEIIDGCVESHEMRKGNANMTDNEEFEEYKKSNGYKESVTKKALNNWIRDGKPNGEEYHHSMVYGYIKIKDIHWKMAEDNVEANWHHNAGGDW